MRSILYAGLGGAVGATVLWFIASRLIDAQLQRGVSSIAPEIASAVQREVPPVVRRELESTLRRYNITPETGRQISSILNAFSASGLLSAMGAR
jgi:hypothetical protein